MLFAFLFKSATITVRLRNDTPKIALNRESSFAPMTCGSTGIFPVISLSSLFLTIYIIAKMTACVKPVVTLW